MDRANDEQIWSWVDRRAPELDEYLAQHPGEHARVHAVREIVDGIGAAAPTPAQAPARVGPYRLGRRLGEGGMGVVYEADQDRPRRKVALKLLRTPGPASPEAAMRLRREADALAKLQHPGIAVVHAAGETEDGVPYLAMELVRGVPLDAYARDHSLDRAGRLALFAKICSAVQHAHAAGLVHRDLKPQNILVTADGQPKVLDFGLATWRDVELEQTLTVTGALVGTLPYMSPEQVGTAPVGAASDVYALGVILYELLLDRLPVDVVGAPVMEAARRIAEEPPLRPRAVQPDLPRDLEAVLLRALAKTPHSRYGSALDLAADVERAATGRPVLAKRWTLRRRAWAHLLRHRSLARIAAEVLAVLCLLGLLVWLYNPALVSRSLPGQYPKLSPFEAMRFRGPWPEVQLDGNWYELVKIEGTSAQRLVADFTELNPHSWRKRFTEDLWQYLWESGRVPSKHVDLLLRDIHSGAPILREDVEMTGAKRYSSWVYRNTLLDSRIRVVEDRVQVAVEGGDPLIVETIGQIDVQALLQASDFDRRVFKNTLLELLTVHEHHRAGDEVRLAGYRGSSGRPGELWLVSDSTDLNRLWIPRAQLAAIYEEVRTP